uniref:Uncharacterized protein n=1 Tax=Mola mola TaxID=94237 RepID=A0A3Q3XLP2_MOLML
MTHMNITCSSHVCLYPVRPSRGLLDEKFAVLVQNVPPGFQLTVHARHKCEDGHSWEAFGHYTADASGTVNGVKLSAGTFWKLVMELYGSAVEMRKMNVQTPMEVTVSAYPGHQTEGFADQVPLAGVVVERWYMAPGPGPFPGLLDVWGGGGRLVEYRAALLASHGFAALALDYLTPKVTMGTGKMVGNDYFEKAYRILETHPQVIGSRIGMLGLSFGTSVSLKMAVFSQVIKLRCVVCISGSHVQPVDGTLEQIMTYFNQNVEKTRINEDNHVIWRDLLLPIPTDLTLKVDVGRLQIPLLLVVGEDDQNWPAYESAMDEMMERAGNSHLLTVLSYPNTGHLIEPPYSPHFRVSIFKTIHVMVLWGGETMAHSHAQEDAWRKILVFLRENLYSGMKPGVTSFL